MKKVTICFIGKARAGKDQSSTYMQEYFQSKGLDLRHMAFADLLKKQCREIAYWDGEKDDEGRELLQEFSKPLKRYVNYLAQKYPDNEFYQDMKNGAYYAAHTLRDIRESDGEFFTITDMRFKDEPMLFSSKDDINFISIRIKRVNPDGTIYTGGLSEEALADISENDLNDYETDYFILNDKGLDELREKVEQVSDEILKSLGYVEPIVDADKEETE